MSKVLIQLTDLWGTFESGLERLVTGAVDDEHLVRISQAATALPANARAIVQTRVHVERIYRRGQQPSLPPPPDNVIQFPRRAPQ